MLKNYIKIAFRNLLKHKSYSLINILGLSLGIGSMLLIFLFSINELRYDRFHKNAEQIYQVYKQRVTPNGIQDAMDLWTPMKDELVSTYSGIEKATRIYSGNAWVEVGNETFEEHITYTDHELFEIFSFPLSEGDNAKPLTNESSIVISNEMAKRFFGNENPIGKILTLDFESDYIVSGILEEIPHNSTIQLDLVVLLSSDPNYSEYQNNWGSSFLEIFVQLSPNTNPQDIEVQFPDFIKRIWNEEVAARTNFKLLSLTELHNYSTNSNQIVFILFGIAISIIIIAVINFVNLATARSLERAKEVGIRKTLGATKSQLVKQFLGESVILSLFALALGYVLVETVLPFFNQALNTELSSSIIFTTYNLVPLLLFTFVIGLMAGIFPAFFLSKFKSSETLKGALKNKPGGIFFRKALVITQFGITTFILFGTFVIWNQLQYLKKADLGFEKAGIIVVETGLRDFADPEAAAIRISTFKNDLNNLVSVHNLSSSVSSPGQWNNSFTFAIPQNWSHDQPARVRFTYVDDAFFETYSINFLEGTNFLNTVDSVQFDKVIVNEAAIKNFGWETGLNKTIQLGRDRFADVIGVVDDYNYESLVTEVAPVLHYYRSSENGVHRNLSVKINAADIPSTLGAIQERWETYFPDRELSYSFVDQTFEQLYENQDRLAYVSGSFTIIIVLISCLGLFALTSLLVIQRTKEIGIRKTLGANVISIVRLIGLDFLSLVGLGFLIASPLAWFFMNSWLQDFAYKIDLNLTIILLCGTVLFILTVLSISYHTIKTSLQNPVESLKSE
ncbi:MAG: ABC transporter permease [Balneolaceae bacterium]